MTPTEVLCPDGEGTQTAAERRAFVRYPCDLDTSCQPIASARGMQWTGKVQNISRGGVSLVLGRRFEQGTLLAIEVQAKEPDGKSRSFLARVMHVSLQGTTTWVMGCKFASPLSDDELGALV